jgi:hypothetical protein
MVDGAGIYHGTTNKCDIALLYPATLQFLLYVPGHRRIKSEHKNSARAPIEAMNTKYGGMSNFVSDDICSGNRVVTTYAVHNNS